MPKVRKSRKFDDSKLTEKQKANIEAQLWLCDNCPCDRFVGEKKGNRISQAFHKVIGKAFLAGVKYQSSVYDRLISDAVKAVDKKFGLNVPKKKSKSKRKAKTKWVIGEFV